MKKFAPLLFLLFAFSVPMRAQSSLFNVLRLAIAEQQPEIDLNEKLIAYSYWTCDNYESRSMSMEFEKVASVYRNAKLKGASKGLVVVLINTTDDGSKAEITFKKDGLQFCLLVDSSNVYMPKKNTGSNGIFDPSGRIVYENLPTDRVYSSVQSLITR